MASSARNCFSYFDYNKTALGLAFLLAGSLLGPCLCAPAPDPWWYNPCDAPTELIRHGRSVDPFIVRRQLITFVNKLKWIINESLNNLYKEVNKTRQPFKGKLPWLKLNQMEKKLKKSTTKLSEFYRALQFFAGTLDVLSHIKVRTDSTEFKNAHRENIYNTTTDNLKLLMCEVHATLYNNHEKIPKGIPANIMGIRLPKNIDLTGAHILDMNFLKKMKKFFTRSQRYFGIKANRKSKKLNKKSDLKMQKRTS